MIKRFFDLILSMALLVVLFPLMVLIAILIWVTDGRPIFFSQERLGKGENVFFIYKYRTMKNFRCDKGTLLPDECRSFFVGNILRKFSLDELPQLWNILKGDMSFVGPRAFLAEYQPLYSLEERKRHTVRPGITGWAQINGRNSLTWKEKFQYDLFYIENRSLFFDLKIMLLTFWTVLSLKGVNSSSKVTMEKYNGKN